MKKIGILGLWHLGCVSGVCLAKQGFRVMGFDFDKGVIDNLQKSTPPIFEPGLENLIKKHTGKNLLFTNSAKEAISGKDYVFITLDTPVNNHDIVSLRLFNLLVKEVEKYLNPGTTLVVSSQVPVGTCRAIEQRLKLAGKDNPVLYFPENLRLGQAIDGFLKPDRIILGGSEKTRKIFLTDFTFFNCPVFEMPLESAEMTKHALNSYLALMISFCSEISDLCEGLGANAIEVMQALKADQRVSVYAPLNPGIGFAGGTLGRDLQTLKMVSRKINYTPKLIKIAYQVNQDRLPKMAEKISNVLRALKGKKIGLLGLTYKPNTNTLRRSQSVELADLLQRLGAEVRAIDPAITPESVLDNSSGFGSLKIYQQYDKFFRDLDAVVLMTWWEEFKALRPGDFASSMKRRIVFDTRNFLDRDLYQKAGFLYVGVGEAKEIQAGK